ncbi:nucleotide sugar dehydrogenase [Zhihengliuella sp.]|uniref:nucleotide sugar dehydrogenase n=1 Tax=Zhihengliuella sp. TaxID=1954483 RepID=UPI00281261EA|nr:nucleotide sugar dehydrogenase [Zhihengliuella sp.]
MGNNLVVIGQGYVGLPLSLAATRAGYTVVGLDANPRTVQRLNAGRSHVDDIDDSEISSMLAHGYRATAEPECIRDADFVVVCVPTPLGEDGSPDLSAIVASAEAIASHVRPGCLVVLESTTYPGTTEEVFLPILESRGATEGRTFHLAFSPERIDPGNPTYRLENTPKLVGGRTPDATRRAVEFYERFVEVVVPMKGPREAETAKLLENTYRHINIALVNEMAKFCHELDIDIWDVIRGSSTKPFGFQAFYPGPGVGGHCIPIDPNYLGYQVKKVLGYPFRFVELAQEINGSMPRYVVSRCAEILNQHKKAINGSRILLIGVTYKPNIADQRESPSAPIASLLQAAGADLQYFDPHVPEWSAPSSPLSSVVDAMASSREADLVVILQDHASVDLDSIVSEAGVVLDCRGRVGGPNVIRL